MKNKYDLRRDALRERGQNFSDLGNLVALSFNVYKKIHSLAAPYNNRQIGSDFYIPPSKELFTENIRRPKSEIENSIQNRMINSAIDFYESTKGTLQLAEPHPSIIHSFQIPRTAFELSEAPISLANKLNKNLHSVKSITKLEIHGFGRIDPIYFENLKIEDFGFLIIRPKMGRTGVPVVNFWEALFFKKHHSFIIDHVDAEINPRYCGLV